MADYLTNDTDLTSVADAIRTKGGTSDPLTYPAGFVSAIEAIPTGSSARYIKPSWSNEMWVNSEITTDGNYTYAEVMAVGTPGSTMYIRTMGDYALDRIVRDDTGTTVPFTTISARNYSFTMPDASVTYYLYYDD